MEVRRFFPLLDLLQHRANIKPTLFRFHRAMTRPFFSKDRIAHFDIFERHAVDALNQLKNRLNEGYAVDIQDLASRFTMDSATEFLFAHDVCSLEAGIPYPFNSPLAAATEAVRAQHPANKFAKAFDEAQRLSALRSRRGYLWPLTEFWKDKVEEQMVVVRSFIEPIVAEALRKKKEKNSIEDENDKEVGEGESLLEHLVKLTDGKWRLFSFFFRSCSTDETVGRRRPIEG